MLAADGGKAGEDGIRWDEKIVDLDDKRRCKLERTCFGDET